MSSTHQNESPSLRETSNLRDVNKPESTPAKKKYGANLAFASVINNNDKVQSHLGKEMEGRWLGAMPAEEFFDEFLPSPKDAPLPDIPENPFEEVPNEGKESLRYDPFITAIKDWMPHLQAVNTSNKEDTANDLNLKTGRISPEMELWVEFKTETTCVAFRDPPNIKDGGPRQSDIQQWPFTPDSVQGNKTRGQLAHYAGALHSQQFRHFSFSILVEGDSARFLRWDPSGTIVTAAFNYRTQPKFMAVFLWRFSHISAEERGYDPSIQPARLAPNIDARVRGNLGIKDKGIPLYRYELPGLKGMGCAYGPKPPTQNRSLVSRCTRNLPVVWIPAEDVYLGTRTSTGLGSCAEEGASSHPNHDSTEKKPPWYEERIIYMKDTWRFISDSLDEENEPEHKIYEKLHFYGTPNIPEHVAGGDVDGGKTRTQDFENATWLCVKPRVSPFQHYRLVHGIVGRALFKFDCTKQLVTAIFDALRAHSHAFDVVKILHRDISAGNIILTDEGRGLLIDWEMAKEVDKRGSRRPDRTGTWQFMSANLLQHPGRMHTLTDDLESFLHVLAWMTLRYLSANDTYQGIHRANDLAKFDEHYRPEGFSEMGGLGKYSTLGAGHYPSLLFQPMKDTPLLQLLKALRVPFKSLYGEPPTDEDRMKTNIPLKRSDGALFRLAAAIDQYDEDIRCLRSSTWFIDTIRNALDDIVWPTDDKADANLSIALLSGNTARRMENKATHRQKTHSIWENSREVSRGSKRAASPTPDSESSSKRRRVTPAASGSHT